MGEELAVFVGADEMRSEVIRDAAENAAKSELCHKIGIPSPYVYNPELIVVVLALPWTQEFWEMVGEKYVNVAPDMKVDRY
jgi:hypothetical protein